MVSHSDLLVTTACGCRWESTTTHLDSVCYLAQEGIHPALRIVRGRERSSDAGVHHDEPLVLLPQVVLLQHLAVRANIEALVLPPDDADVRLAGDQVDGIRVAVEDEDEVGLAVQPGVQEVLEIISCVLRLGIRVEYQRSQPI